MSATPFAPSSPSLQRQGATISAGRRVRNGAWWVLCALGFALVAAPVVWILVSVISNAASSWRWSIFTNSEGADYGGLLNAIEGTFVMMVGVALIAGFVGIGTGMWLAEVAKPGPLRAILRGASEVLSGIPSIVLGYVGYLALVYELHWGFSLIPALVTLSVLVVPYVAKATDLALSQVPVAYREGGEALGMRRTQVMGRIVLRSAIPGIATGLILALAISVGETAPLLYTAGTNSGYWNGAFIGPAATSQMPFLTYATWTYYQVASPAAQALAHDAALLLVVLVVVLILSARLVVRLTQKYSPERAATAGGGWRGRRAMRAMQRDTVQATFGKR
ncbi:MAG TPA: phosphate ABC transporter permease PstA [Acidimicrobiales bacterium]|nr:phosphate ABC transporter permease PstA [Acidimicrobiales bacterium]